MGQMNVPGSKLALETYTFPAATMDSGVAYAPAGAIHAAMSRMRREMEILLIVCIYIAPRL